MTGERKKGGKGLSGLGGREVSFMSSLASPKEEMQERNGFGWEERRYESGIEQKGIGV